MKDKAEGQKIKSKMKTLPFDGIFRCTNAESQV
jgi:hypothetical protein